MQQLDAFVPSDSADGLAAWEDTLLRHIVAAFVDAHRWLREESEDLLQEVRWHYLQHQKGYDGRQQASAATYLRVVAGNRLLDRLKRHFSECRNNGVWPLRLDVSTHTDKDGEPVFIDAVDRQQDTTSEALTALARARALARLDQAEQRIVRAFEAGATKAEVSAGFGIAPATLYDQRLRIRRAFTEEGFAPPPPRQRRGRRCPEPPS
jgi:RNA polymerase sigma factor (sigma-70 family)